MKKLEFSITINAPGEKVWKALWEDSSYRKWTNVFGEGSYAESDWKEGGKIHFLLPTGEGMYSRIDKLVPYRQMSFLHEGPIKDFKELPPEKDTESWYGNLENYYLSEQDNSTVLKVDLVTVDDYISFFEEKFPAALRIVKELAEK